jgi:hypothetical protein
LLLIITSFLFLRNQNSSFRLVARILKTLQCIPLYISRRFVSALIG